MVKLFQFTYYTGTVVGLFGYSKQLIQAFNACCFVLIGQHKIGGYRKRGIGFLNNIFLKGYIKEVILPVAFNRTAFTDKFIGSVGGIKRLGFYLNQIDFVSFFFKDIYPYKEVLIPKSRFKNNDVFSF